VVREILLATEDRWVTGNLNNKNGKQRKEMMDTFVDGMRVWGRKMVDKEKIYDES
jgi:hypothetical protein